MYRLPAEIGARVEEIDTPALLIDLSAFERNVRKMAEFAQARGLRCRPHAKTHRCPTIALKQIAAGAVGQCCQKVGEAEALVRGGVLVSNQVVSEAKLRRLAALAVDARVGLCFDAPEQIEVAARVARDFGVELDALVEIEVGMQRCGVAPGEPARELAGRIAEAPGLRFRGLQAYQGAAQHLATWKERERAIESAAQSVRATLEALDRAGIDCAIVGGAGTGTYALEGASGLWNELQVGSYIFMDVEYGRILARDGGRYSDFEHSLFVLATVMSAPSPERAVLDAGLKSYSAEQGMPWVHGRTDLEVYGIADEHSKVRLGADSARLKLGDKLLLIPSHCDPTVNLHDWYVGVRNGRVEALWPITGRGASS